MKFYALFKKRLLVAPLNTQTETPNASPGTKNKSGVNPQTIEDFAGDELLEKLLPKIFDDVVKKGWKDINSNIDLKIALEFLSASLEHSFGGYEEKLQVSYLLTVQKQRFEDIQTDVKQRYEQQLAEVYEVIDVKKKPLTEKAVIERLMEIRNTAIIRLETCSKFAMTGDAEEQLQEHIGQVRSIFDEKFKDIIEKSMLLSS